MTNEMPFVPIKMNDACLAFGPKLPYGDWEGNEFIPSGDQIPEEFKLFGYGAPAWVNMISDWFYNGLPADTVFFPKEGIDPVDALSHIGAIMRSFTPKHEHKTAACAYLASLWFDNVEITGGKSISTGWR